MTENFCHEQCIIRNGILHYFSRATQAVNDNVMKNVLSLTTRVGKVNPILYFGQTNDWFTYMQIRYTITRRMYNIEGTKPRDKMHLSMLASVACLSACIGGYP